MFLDAVLQKTEFLCRKENQYLSVLEASVVVVDRALGLLRELSLQDNDASIDVDKLEHLNSLSGVFAEISSAMKQLISLISCTLTTVAENCCSTSGSSSPGRPWFHIFVEVLEDLRKLVTVIGVSRWTILKTVKDYGLQDYFVWI